MTLTLPHPCWVRGAETPNDLQRVHIWNEMTGLLLRAAAGPAEASDQMTTNLTAMCQTMCRGGEIELCA